MNSKQYIHEIADRTCLPYAVKRKIVRDLRQEFEASLKQGYSEEEVMARMGDPDEIAAGLYDNYISTEEIERPFSEYKSQTQLWGMPLVHIVKAKRRPLLRTNHSQRDFFNVPQARGVIAIGRRARGIVAIGNLTTGVVAIGNISIGVLSISNIGVGLVAVGNLILGLLRAIGNVAVGLFAAGNLAIGYGAVGNESMGRYAIGNEAMGNMALTVHNFISQGPEIQNFISKTPPFLQPLFQDAVTMVHHWIWLAASAGIFLLLLLIVWIVVCRKLDAGEAKA